MLLAPFWILRIFFVVLCSRVLSCREKNRSVSPFIYLLAQLEVERHDISWNQLFYSPSMVRVSREEVRRSVDVHFHGPEVRCPLALKNRRLWSDRSWSSVIGWHEGWSLRKSNAFRTRRTEDSLSQAMPITICRKHQQVVRDPPSHIKSHRYFEQNGNYAMLTKKQLINI